MKFKKVIRILIPLFVTAVIFGVAHSALADVKGTENFYAWDRTGLQFNNSVADIYFDGSFVEVFSQLSFDTDLYTPVAEDQSACEGTPTSYAGRVLLRFDHEDANPAGALGMVRSQAWQLVDCDFDGSGTIDAADRQVDLGASPPISYTTAELTLIYTDTVVPAGGAIQSEIVTEMFVNIDSTCDNSLVDEPLPTGGVVCFFAQGVTPTLAQAGPPGSRWNNANLQAAFGGASGDKTVNLKPFGPNAITLENLTARSDFSAFLIFGGVLIVLVASLIIAAAWRMRQDGKAI